MPDKDKLDEFQSARTIQDTMAGAKETYNPLIDVPTEHSPKQNIRCQHFHKIRK